MYQTIDCAHRVQVESPVLEELGRIGSEVGERERPIGRKAITVMARNEPPALPCEHCGQPATEVCSKCVWSGGGWLCDACAKTYACGDEMLSSVVNSPRVEICGYTG